MNNFLIIVLGPTGIGKTDITIEIAKYYKTEIISADSRQIYKEMKIGTAVPSDEELKQIKHHFIRNKSIQDYYNASMYEFEVLELLEKIFKNKNIVCMTGGSGLYIDAVCYGIDDIPNVDKHVRKELTNRFKHEGIESLRKELKYLDPEYYNKVDLKNPKRILKALEISIQTGKPYSSFLTKEKKARDFRIIKIGLEMDREVLYERINKRVDKMIEDGLQTEVKKLIIEKDNNALNTVGYKELFDFLEGGKSLEEAIELIKRNTRHYARKQITWFNRYDDIKWFNPDNIKEIILYINGKISSNNS
ncbi:tRNA (adenosine(37)-N6)-dimethylallyltransferase MiaA [Bacteroidota bacterium]